MNRLFIIVLVALVAGAAQPGAQSNPELEKLFASAQHKATVEGEPRRAIADYELIIARANGNRAITARALMGLAEVYRALSDRREQDALKRIVNDYPEQPVATRARERLAALTSAPARSASTSQAIRGLPGDPQSHVSRDGRWLPYIDWSTNNLFLHDIKTGRNIALTDTGARLSIPKQQYPGYSRISPDGKRIVFSWFNSQRYEIRLLDIEPPGQARPVTLYHNAEVEYMHPFAWSPDGTMVAVGLQRLDRTGQLALLSTRDGSLRVLKSFPWREEMSGIAFSPDGKWLAYDLPPDDDSLVHDVYAMSVDGSPREVTVAANRRNDWIVTWSRDGRDIIFASDRTGSTQLWAQRFNGGVVQGDPRPIVSDYRGAFLGMSDDGAFYDVLTTHSASQFRVADFDVLRGRATSVPIDPGEEYFSSNSRAQAEWSPDGRSLALLRRTGPDPMGTLISVLGPDGARIRDVRPQLGGFGYFVWSRDGKSFLAPGHELKGRAGIVRVDATSGAGRIIAAESESPGGLAVLGESPDGRHLYYAATRVSGLALIAHEIATQTQREIATLAGGDQPRVAGYWNPHLSPDGTLIVASVWQEGGGRALEVISVASGQRRRLTPGNGYVLTWAPDSRSVLLQRGPDGSQQVLRLSIETGEETPLDWNLEGDSHSFRVHPDGRRIIYVLLASSATSQLRRLTGIPAQLQDKRSEF